MKQYNAKRFNGNSKHSHSKHSNNPKKSLSLKLFLLILIIFLAVIAILYFKFPWDISTSSNTNVEENISANNIIADISDSVSPFETKSFDNMNYLSVEDLSLKYENNVTFIKFNLYNNSSEEQKVFDFTFTLLDENGNQLISYNLSSKDLIPGNNHKEFVLLATRDVSNATDYTISTQIR